MTESQVPDGLRSDSRCHLPRRRLPQPHRNRKYEQAGRLDDMSRRHPFNLNPLTLTLFRKQNSRCCTFNVELKHSETAAGHATEEESVLRRKAVMTLQICKWESTIDPSEQQLCNSIAPFFVETRTRKRSMSMSRSRPRQQAGKGLLKVLFEGTKESTTSQ